MNGTNGTYSNHQAMIVANPIMFILLVCLIPVVGLGLIALLAWYLISRNTKLEILNGKVLFTRGIISKDQTEFAVNSIRSFKINQGLWDRIVGTGTIRIVTAGDTPEVIAAGMPDVARIRRLLSPPDGSQP